MYLNFAVRSSSLLRGLNSAQIDMNDPSVLRIEEMFPLSSVPSFPSSVSSWSTNVPEFRCPVVTVASRVNSAQMDMKDPHVITVWEMFLFAPRSSSLHVGLSRCKWI